MMNQFHEFFFRDFAFSKTNFFFSWNWFIWFHEFFFVNKPVKSKTLCIPSKNETQVKIWSGPNWIKSPPSLCKEFSNSCFFFVPISKNNNYFFREIKNFNVKTGPIFLRHIYIFLTHKTPVQCSITFRNNPGVINTLSRR